MKNIYIYICMYIPYKYTYILIRVRVRVKLSGSPKKGGPPGPTEKRGFWAPSLGDDFSRVFLMSMF